VPSGPSPDLASFLSEDCALEVFGKLSDSLVLRRLVATCRIWQRLLRCGPNTPAKALWDQAWLPVSGANAPRVLKHAPVGERIRILSGATLRGQIVCGHALHVKAEPGVKLTGCLYLQGGACGSAASREEEAIPAHLFGGLEQQREGVIEGLCFEHYMDAAVFVRGGSWHLTNCHITSSRRNNRSVTAIQIRENGCLRLDACTVTRAAHACEIDRGWCTLVCNDCTFSDTKAAVITRGGGCVVIERSTFSGNDQALKLDDLVHGHAEQNVLDGSMFGRWARPESFRCRGNTYPETASDADESEEDEAVAEAGSSASGADSGAGAGAGSDAGPSGDPPLSLPASPPASSAPSRNTSRGASPPPPSQPPLGPISGGVRPPAALLPPPGFSFACADEPTLGIVAAVAES